MLHFKTGNLFDSQAEAYVNAVNCKGVMGKGIALQFKRTYPDMFREYKARCERGEVRLGELTTFQAESKLVVNFPTKDHWRSKSTLEPIRTGLAALRELIEQEAIPSIALPALGCGLGGLEWRTVKVEIEKALDGLLGVEVEIYEPR